MKLDQAMQILGTRPIDVARATGLHAATVIRVRDEVSTPNGATMLKLDRWAMENGILLSWEHLVQ